MSGVEWTLCVFALLATLLVAGPAVHAQGTPEPTVPSSRFRFWTVGMTPPNPELSFYWTAGDGEGAIVLMREGTAVNADPVDGVVYADNLTFASGEEIGVGNRVVYQGTATQIVVTVPRRDVTYHVAVYEYNGSGTGIEYLQTSPARGRSGHNAAHGIDCAQCHFAVGDSHGTFLRTPRDGQQETICLSCHSELGEASAKADVAIHTGPNYSVSVDCGSCHMAHNNFDFTTTDTHSGGVTAGNVEWVRPDTTKYVAGALEPALFQANTGFFAYDDANSPWNGICQTCHTQTDRHRNNASVAHSHEVALACTSCHEHKTGFPPGDCVGCHKQQQEISASPGTYRRQVTESSSGAQDGEFASGASGFRSHHVNDGTADQVVTKWDCVVCHAEGNALTGAPDDTYHKKDGVQLKDTDTGAVYSNWADLLPSQRSDFCLSCHDIDGATIIKGRTDLDPDATTDPLNPFNDGLTNAHEPDGLDGTPAPHSRGAVVDVDAQFDTANASHHAVLGAAYGSAAPFGSGVDNAIQGVRTDLAWNSTLDCEDCHYGTGTTMLSGHGTANARYMLRDKDGSDTLAVDPNTNCYRCHSPADAVSVYPEHDKGAHIDDSLNLYEIACLNCHGGGTWGGIHGVNDPVTDDGGAGSFTPNVFTYGAGLDYISNWTSWANRGVSCSSKSGADRINSCDHHSSTTQWSRGETRTYRAP